MLSSRTFTFDFMIHLKFLQLFGMNKNILLFSYDFSCIQAEVGLMVTILSQIRHALIFTHGICEYKFIWEKQIFSDMMEILKIILNYLSVVKSNDQRPYKEKSDGDRYIQWKRDVKMEAELGMVCLKTKAH